MASNLKLAYASANTEADALAALCNGGSIKVYDGTQPATPETAVSTQTLLATITLNSTAFGASSNGVITAGQSPALSATIAATGVAAWFRVLKSNGTTAVFDGSVGVSGADLNINSIALSSGATLSISSFTYTVTGY